MATVRIGGYELISVVGQGSFGKAVLVKNKDGVKQIMKLINTRQMSKHDIEEANREIQVLMKLVDAPFIVHYRNTLNEVYQSYPHLCIVMDFCSGGDLGKLIRERKRQQKPFSELTLRTWLLQLTIAIDYMHSHKVLHRDLKPANVFLDESNYIRVGDLGLSKILEFTMQQAQTQCGTPAFMAPELCKGRPYQTAADIWAIGCIIVEAATFELPFRGNSLPELSKNICNAAAPRLSSRYSDDLRTMCEHMLKKDPAQRPSSKTILESNLLKADWAAYKQKHIKS